MTINSYRLWSDVKCPMCKEIDWDNSGKYGQTCKNCGYKLGFGAKAEDLDTSSKCHHVWFHVPRSDEELNEFGDIYKCLYCLTET